VSTTTTRGPTIGLAAGEILAAFLRLAEAEQEKVRNKVEVANDPKVTEDQRRNAEAAILAALRLGSGGNAAARPLRDEERLSPAHLAVREKIECDVRLFADTLARLLAEKQMTQAELARRIGVGQSAISMMLSRACRPQPRTLGKLADALGVTVEKLWPGKPGL
jgi:lambda repressor-like predicted transcriptional regulator